MRKYMCITALVKEVYDPSKVAFQGTEYENDCFFYHNTLSQMTAKSKVEWMKEHNIYRRWLIPQNGCNTGVVYTNLPMGNSPQFMPLDNSSNQDIQVGISLNYAVTVHLHDHDSRKFSMQTPNTIHDGIMNI